MGQTALPCDRVAELLPEFLDEPQILVGSDADHVAQCLRCQAEMARYRRLARILAGLRDAPSGLIDPQLFDDFLKGLHSEADRRQWHWTSGRRAASFVGLAAATAAGVGGVLVLANRRRSA